MSEVWVYFWKIGIKIFQSQKPDLGNGFEKSGKKAIYYGSLEYKESTDGIKGSRACGVLLGGTGAYVVYNTMIKKNEVGQENGSIHAHLDRAYAGYRRRLKRADSVILGAHMEVLLELLNSDGGIKKNLYQVDDVYECAYFGSSYFGSCDTDGIVIKHRKKEEA